ncbi:hypothetical protein DID75_02340 [Candidatus Marinamargulisbacteria bacterium SCGC AG-410-N11]|nr:hypothetical protein DID75_02335 [Candidatus Marinamargulisbacteria bacterium SCGC AG-410-N11]RAP33413.1 hypothetical protein DID75_02340 [Candidatus Marinamargulisbacteria bacterium SCGC AG-410-N11]
MKKSIALIALLATLVAPVVAATGTGIGINIGTSYTYNLKSQFKNGQATNIALEFNTRGGSTFYIQNENGTWRGESGKSNITGSESVTGLGVRVPVADSVGLDVMIGNATTNFQDEAAVDNDNFGTAATEESSTDPIADLGAYVERTYGDVSVAGTVSYRHHMLSNEIQYAKQGVNGNTVLNNKSGVRAGVRISYSF